MVDAYVIVVGGGAAGLVAAIAAAREGASVTVLEASKRVGQKILKTGNGRCNLTNAMVGPSDFNDHAFVEPVLERYSFDAILEFFDSIGLMTAEPDEEGRIYPYSNTAVSVLDVLRDACACLGVEIQCERKVIDIRANDRAYDLICEDGTAHAADQVVVCTGGATKLLASLGHRIVPFHPALCPIKTETHALKGLSGVRAHARVSAFHEGDEDPYFEEMGEVLFRDYGLSGIVTFDLSRYVRASDIIELDFLPDLAEKDFEGWMNSRYARICKCSSEASFSELLCGVFHPRVDNAVIRMARQKPSALADPQAFGSIAHAAKSFSIKVLGLGDPKQAQITRGGASLDEFDALTLESRLAPGIYAAGETLNVDGRCGGFNLHWAWASGLASGSAAAHCKKG